MTDPRLEGDPPTHFRSPLLEEAGLPHLFTTRNFPGVTAFRDPYPPLGSDARPLLAENGLDSQPAAFLKQVHGAAVIQATAGGLAGNADAIGTHQFVVVVIGVSTAFFLPLSCFLSTGEFVPMAGRSQGL